MVCFPEKTKPNMNLEICCGSYQSALAASKAGATRIELCSGLAEGGITPSLGLVRAACTLPNVVHHVLIRPRGGDFLYTETEKRIILDDIDAAIHAGADGVVVGALTDDGEVDLPFLEACVNHAAGRNVTFHRAFDLCADAMRAMKQIADAGANRILTSGQAATAVEGIGLLAKLTKEAPEGLSIMPGCGVNAANAAKLLKETGANELHASARAPYKSRMRFVRNDVNMGAKGADEYATLETSEEAVEAILRAMRTVEN